MRKVGAAILAACVNVSLAVVQGPALANGLDGPSSNLTASLESDLDKSGSTEGEQTLTGPYASLITEYADKFGVSPKLADAVVRIESNYDPKARGSAGEIGLMQIKPATARMMGYDGSIKGLYNPVTNIEYGMKYLAAAEDLGDGSTCDTILKYNAGHAAKHMNPISKRYCGRVLSYID